MTGVDLTSNMLVGNIANELTQFNANHSRMIALRNDNFATIYLDRLQRDESQIIIINKPTWANAKASAATAATSQRYINI